MLLIIWYAKIKSIRFKKIYTFCSHSKLRQCPARLSFMGPQLTQLNLSHNSLCHIPEEICCLTGLREMYLHHNHLTSIPVSCLVLLVSVTCYSCQMSMNIVIPVSEFKNNIARMPLNIYDMYSFSYGMFMHFHKICFRVGIPKKYVNSSLRLLSFVQSFFYLWSFHRDWTKQPQSLSHTHTHTHTTHTHTIVWVSGNETIQN